MLVVGTVWGLVFAPEDYQQGNSFRIIYLHVPSAILAQSCYMMMAVAAIISLVWKMKLADMFIASAAATTLPFIMMALNVSSSGSFLIFHLLILSISNIPF